MGFINEPVDDMLKLFSAAGFLCEGPGSEFLRQSKRCDFMHV